MGANFVSFNLKGGKLTVAKEFELRREQDLYDNGHSYSGGIGMASGLEFEDRLFASDDDADEALVENCQKWEEAKAVRVGDHWRIGAWCAS